MLYLGKIWNGNFQYIYYVIKLALLIMKWNFHDFCRLKYLSKNHEILWVCFSWMDLAPQKLWYCFDEYKLNT
jgi:hypothetical protein